MPIVAICIMIVLAGAGIAGAYKTGETNGANSRDLHWKSQIEAANAQAQEMQTALVKQAAQADESIRVALASKQQEIKDRDDALEQARQSVPLSGDCSKCVIDARRLRTGSTSPDRHPQTLAPGSGTK
jgi:hypothetical protein